MVEIGSGTRLLALVVALLTSSAQAPITHTTHYPKHGGQFFTAARDTVHLEGVWPQQRVFRLYVYDQLTRLLPLDRLREITGRVTAGGRNVPLVLDAGEGVFEARIPTLKPPAEIAVEVLLAGAAEPEGFTFIFPTYSDDSALTFALEPTAIPDTLAGTVAALRDDARDTESLLERRQSAFVFAPAGRGRDHALALERFLPQIAAAARPRVEAAIRATVRTSWLLHVAGDDGTEDQVRAAAAAFRAAVEEMAAAFAPGAP